MRKQDAAGEEWRASMQDEQMWKILKPVGTALNVLGIAVMCAAIPDQTWVPGVAGCMVMALLWFGSREVREYGAAGLVAVLTALTLGFGIVVNGNHYLNFDTEPPVEYTVVGTDRTNRSRGGDRYYAVMEIDTGREVRIPLSYDRYKVTHPGDTVPVYDDTGAFGIRYAWYAEE